MNVDYFNYEVTAAGDSRQVGRVLRGYWQLLEGEKRWTPPYFPQLRAALQAPYLAERTVALVRLDAMVRRRMAYTAPRGMAALAIPTADPSMGTLPVPVATGLLLRDLRAPRTAHLALLACLNDEAVLERLLEVLGEAARQAGLRQIVGPLELSPFLGGGAQLSHWHEPAPLHAPYAPPYLAELLGRVLRQPEGAPQAAGWPVSSGLWHMPVPAAATAPAGPAALMPLVPERLGADLLPLLSAAAPPGWARPREQDAAFLLAWLGRWPLWGWLAEVAGEPAGFILLQPDVGRGLRRLGGGRRRWRRWPGLAARGGATTGRLLFGAVLPPFRGRGIGRQLWQQALADGHARGWETLTIGPVPDLAETTVAVLHHLGAAPHQRFRLYSTDV